MKPFNLELALAGYAVVTRGGQIVTGLYEVKCRETANWLSGQRCGFICTWNINGSSQQGAENRNDLFMKTKTKVIEGWVNVYEHGYSGSYESEEVAKYSSSSEVLKTIKISTEVEI